MLRAIHIGPLTLPVKDVLIGLGQRHRGRGYRFASEVSQRALGTIFQVISIVGMKRCYVDVDIFN